jgi:tol-pal system protein YbgF
VYKGSSMMRRRRRLQRFWAIPVFALAFAGCATKGDIRALQTELREELVSLIELRAETMSTQDTLRTQSDQIFDFRGEITRQLQSISQGMARLEAISGENQRGIASVRDQLANTRRLPTGSAQPTQLADSASSSTNPESVAGAGGNAVQLYGVAREQHLRNSFSTAQRAYEQFLADFPSHALAPDARFFLADVLIQLDRPEDALETLQEITTLHPTATRVPDALYRVAVLQNEAGDEDAAKATLERIINTYPDATITLLARDLLAEIG